MTAPMSLAAHHSTAHDLAVCRERLMALIAGERALPKSSRAGRCAVAALAKIDALRSALDGPACELPGAERPEQIYYGPGGRSR